MIGVRSTLLQLAVSSQLFVHCSTGGFGGSHFVIAVNTEPSWSPDEDRIAYVHQMNSSENGQENSGPHEIWVYSFAADASQYWAQGTEPAWSPDGSLLAYIGGDGHLWVASGPGPTHTLVATVSGASSPCWSPDGGQILFRRESESGPSTFYTVNADGSRLTSTQVEGL